MAEIVLVAAIIPKLITLIEGEIQLHRNMRGELLTIKGELENMKAFLMMAENSPEEGSLLDEVWVKQVREIAFKSEDIVDEFMLNFERDHLTCLDSIFHSFNLGALHDLASRIKEVISRFKIVRESNQRYRTDLALNPVIPPACHRWYNPQQDPLFNDDTLVGIENRKRDFISMLLDSDISTLKVVSVYGTGGVGKTSFLRKVYDDEEVKRKFKTRAWITVSRTFDLDTLFKNLIGQLQMELMQPEFEELGNMRNLGLKQEVDKLLQNMGSVDLQQKAKEILLRNTYLVVLDDIWSIDAWNAIKNTFPDLGGSRLLITTRNENIALAASNGKKNYTFNLEPLSEDHWLPLFCKKTFNTDSCPEDLAEVTQSILKKCGGVPLAIVAISGVLVTKEKSAIEWEKINRNIGTALDSTKRVLSLSYTDLPYHLKPCYLYLSIFPEDHLIKKSRLIRLWIAEGFVERTDNMTREEMAESYLKEFVQRSLIQAADSLNEGINETYCIHDLLRDVIYEKAKNHDFATIARENNGPWPWPEQVRRLSLHKNLSILQERQTLGRLRSLFTFGVTQTLTESSVPSLFSKVCNFKLLNVLDMEGTILNEFPTTIIKLRNLKYLNLSHTDLKRVPSSICRLQKLETLDLRYTHVTELPTEILKLQRLHNLQVFQYKNSTYPVHGFKAPAGVDRLESLQSLLYVDAGPGCGYVAKEIGLLTQLRRLCIANFSNENAIAICSSLNYLCDLQVLSLSSSESEVEAMDLQHLVSPSKSLVCLYLTGKLESLPPWMETLQNLVQLFMRSSKLQRDPLETLGLLSSLVQLELHDACTAYILQFKTGMFRNLKILALNECEHLVQVIFQHGTTPNLERIKIVSCHQLRQVPSGILRLPRLLVLDYVNMPAPIFMASDLFENVGHIEEVNWVYKDNDTWKTERLTPAGNRSRRKNLMLGNINRYLEWHTVGCAAPGSDISHDKVSLTFMSEFCDPSLFTGENYP